MSPPKQIQMDTHVFTKKDLISLKPKHDLFVGIDSDGCVFPTMEIKQKKCLHNLIVSHWRLEKIEKYVRESAEFVNLYSIHRGRNRFPCLLLSIDLIRNRPEVIASKANLPEFKSLKRFIGSGVPLSNAELEKAVNSSGDKELSSILKWSQAANELIAKTVKNVEPFKWVRESLQKIKENADAICVSQTPNEALVREWDEHNLMGFVRVIAGQELGTKGEHIHMVTEGCYDSDKILIIGDAPGDREAALDNHAHFYPINPGHESDSWERFYKESFLRFIDGKYYGSYEQEITKEFQALLPSLPPWKKPEPYSTKGLP